jgi:hypothetical protein
VRYYQSLWEKLKQDKVVSVTANRLLHPRIIKAVTKEKWMDIGYKLQIEPRRALLSHSRTHSILTFKLELKLDVITLQDI